MWGKSPHLLQGFRQIGHFTRAYHSSPSLGPAASLRPSVPLRGSASLSRAPSRFLGGPVGSETCRCPCPTFPVASEDRRRGRGSDLSRWDLRSFARGAASIPGPSPIPHPFAPGVGVGRTARTCRAHVGKVDGKPYTPNTVHNTNGNDGRTATAMKMIVMCNRTGRILAASQGNRAPWSKLAGSQRTAMLSRGPVPGC